MNAPEPLLIWARFNPLVRPYLVILGAAILSLTLIGIPLALVWVLGPGQWWARHYYDRLLCEVTDTELRFRKGILFQIEKTIPLENIQDVTFIEGPLLRRFQLSTLKFETAAHGAGQANHMQLVGIIDAHALRASILERRQALRLRGDAIAPGQASDEQLAVLRDIRDRLDQIAVLLRPSR